MSVTLLDGAQEIVDGYNAVELIPNEGQNTIWTKTFLDIPEDALYYEITWTIGDYIWIPSPTLSGTINWTMQDPEVVRSTECEE